MKLKLADIAHLAEVVAAIAVVISLIYVGVQVRDSTRAVRSAAANDANVAMQSWYLEVGTNPQTSALVIQGLRGTRELSVEEEYQYLMMMHAIFLGFQNSFLLVQEGSLDPSISEAITTALLGVKDLPGFERYWRQRKDYLHVGFAKHVEELRSRPTIGTVDIYRTEQGAGNRDN